MVKWLKWVFKKNLDTSSDPAHVLCGAYTDETYLIYSQLGPDKCLQCIWLLTVFHAEGVLTQVKFTWSMVRWVSFSDCLLRWNLPDIWSDGSLSLMFTMHLIGVIIGCIQSIFTFWFAPNLRMHIWKNESNCFGSSVVLYVRPQTCRKERVHDISCTSRTLKITWFVIAIWCFWL